MSPVSPDIAPNSAPKKQPLSRREFLFLSLLAVGSASGLLAALDRTANTMESTPSVKPGGTPSPEAMPPILSEELASTLEYWMVKQDYDHKFLEPLEEYAKNLYETSPDKGWIEVENNPALNVWVGESDSPELLQKSHAVLFKVNDDLRGFIWNDDGTYSLQGEGEDRVEGTMSHFSGEVEVNYEGTFEDQIPIDSYAPFSFLMVWKGPNKWRGSIYFRGHDRPFGGGKDQDSFPKSLTP